MKVLNNHKGFTLVELLISFALLSLVVLLVTSLHLFGQNQVVNQTNQAELQSNVRLALNTITREIRSAEISVKEEGNNTLIIDDTNIFRFIEEEKAIYHNDQVFVTGIEEFTPHNEDSRINITIKSIQPKQGSPIESSTTIYFRGEGE